MTNTAVITLIVAVATFILQEGLTNIIHGIIFNLFSKIRTGDRIEVISNGISYTGKLTKRTIRHVIINDISTNAEIIIPNSLIDSCVIKNSYNGLDTHNRWMVEYPVSYSDAEDPNSSEIIKKTIREVVDNCDLTINDDKTNIYVNYKDSYVAYTFLVVTSTVEDNFKACSIIRETLMQKLAKDGIHIPFNTITINNTSRN